MIQIVEKSKCCGCSACTTVCPRHCIVMIPDDEGFTYPVVDQNVCIHCGRCEKICPVLNANAEEPFQQSGYIVRSRHFQIRKKSAAGGAFAPMARYIVEHGGYVSGVILNEQFRAQHMIYGKGQDLSRFQGSKYMQSDLNGSFLEIRKLLDCGKTVLFSGTPCQVEGLLNSLEKAYQNLITVDVVCHSVPSPLLFEKYIQYIEDFYHDHIVYVYFRDKHYGYDYPTMKLVGEKRGDFYHHGMESDPWLRAFFSQKCDRPSCYNCVFKKQYRRSDFTIWDCHDAALYGLSFRDQFGATKMLIHSSKGKTFFKKIADQYEILEVAPQKLVENSPAMWRSVQLNSDMREKFFEDVRNMSGIQLFKKHFPLSRKAQMKHVVRVCMYRLGIQKTAKIFYHRLKEKKFPQSTCQKTWREYEDYSS